MCVSTPDCAAQDLPEIISHLFEQQKKARRMNACLALGIAIVAEVIATTALKASDSFTRLLPSLLAVAGYTVAFSPSIS
jgi:hypothetical protein